MRLTGLFAAREGLIVEGAALSTVADNLANMNTTGFKTGRPEFANLLADSEGSMYGSPLNPGNGVKMEEIRTLHDEQGTFDFTDRALDAGIDGNGYFLLTDGEEQFYTRAGNFTIDKTGQLATEDGMQVMGFTTASPEQAVVLSTAGITGVAAASTTASLGGNLNATAPLATAPAPGATFQEISAASDLVAPVTVIDSLGQEHDVSLYFFHTTNLRYTVQAYVDGSEVTAGTAEGTASLVGTSTMTFDSSGVQPEGAAATLNIATPWANGANASAVTVDLSALTSFASPSALSQATVDGNRAGSPTGYEIDQDGAFNVTLDTGDRVKVGDIVVAKVQNKNGLEKVGDNRFREGSDAGEIDVGKAGEEGRGTLVGGALENSTVDPAGEFIDLVRYQRAYQASSQVITTFSELLTTTLQLA